MRKLFEAAAIALCMVGVTSVSFVQAQEKSISQVQEMSLEEYEKLRKVMFEGTPDDLEKLLNNGLNVNGTYRCHSPLNMAIKTMAFAFGSVVTPVSPEETLKKIKILIAAGADVNKEPCSTMGSTPLRSAIHLPFQLDSLENAFNEVITNYIDGGNEKCEFFGISKNCLDINQDDRDRIKYLIGQLYKSAQEGLQPYMMETIKLLVNSGADVNKKDINGKMSLHYATLEPRKTTLEPLRYLISKGANVNVRDNNGNTPLFLASASGSKEAVKILIDAGADEKFFNNEGLYYNEVIGRIKRTYQDLDGKIQTEYTE